MALSEPRSLADFQDKLKIMSAEWRTRENRQIDGQGSGQIIKAELAPDLWEMHMVLAVGYHADARQVRAVLNSFAPVGRRALIYDPIAMFPAADPTGSILGASTVTIHAIGEDRDTIRLTGMPAAYVITVGDKIEVQYGSSPLRRMLLEASETVTADSGGVTPSFAVYPHVRPGISAGAAVNLRKPCLRMMRVQHSAGSSRAVFHDGMSITFIEKVV